MASSSDPPTPPQHRRRRRLRRLGRVLLWGTGGLALLVVVLWGLRRELLAPLIRPRLEATLAQALAAEHVSIGELGGTWFSSLDVHGVTITGAQGTLREVHDARVEARVDAVALLRGDWRGVHTVTVTAASVELDLRPPPVVPPPPPPRVAAPFAFDTLLALVPDGATVHVGDVRVRAPHGERRGALDLTVAPGSGARHVRASYPGLTVAARFVPPAVAGDPPRLEAELDVDAPGEVLDLFGAGGGARGGTLRAELAGSFAPPSIEVRRLALRDVTHAGRRLDRSELTAHVDANAVTVPHATLDLPGVAIELRDVHAPSPWHEGPFAWHTLRGAWSVHTTDVAPYADLLPPVVRELGLAHARLAGAVEAGVLRLEPSELHLRGLDVAVRAGSFAFATADWRAAAGAVQLECTLREFHTTALPLPGAVWNGTVRGRLGGSLAAPQAELQLALGPLRSDSAWLADAHGTVRLNGDTLAVDDLQVRGLGLAALGDGVVSQARVSARGAWRDGALVPDSLAAELEATSPLPAELLATQLAAAGLGPGPSGETSVRARLRHDASGIVVHDLQVETEPGSPVELTVDGAGTLPLHWSGAGAPRAVAAGELTLRVAARRAPGPAGAAGAPNPAPATTTTTAAAATAAPSALPFALAGELVLGAGTTTLRGLTVHAGAATVRGEGTAERGVAAWLDGVDVATTPVRGTLTLAELALANVPPRWLGGVRLAGRATGTVRVAGDGAGLVPEVELDVHDGALGTAGIELENVRLRLDVRTDAAAAAASVVTLDLAATLPDGLASDPTLRWQATVRCDDRGTTLAPSVLELGGSRTTIELASDLGRADVCRGTLDPAAVSLRGSIALAELPLERLPPVVFDVWLPGMAPRGAVTAAIELDGTLADVAGPTIVRAATVRLRDGELKLADLPRFEHVGLDLAYAPAALTLHALTATVGAGTVTAAGTARAASPSLDAFARSRIELRVDGDDVLLFRDDGAKVRATLHVTATGTPQSLAIAGDVALGRGSKFVRRLSLIPNLAERGGESAATGMDLGGLPPSLGDRLHLDVALRTSAAFEVRTGVFDGDVDVAGRLRGTGTHPRLEGTLALRTGMLRFPGANLRVTSGLLTFSRSEPRHPEVLVQAEGRRMGFTITMTISGRHDRPLVQLSSVPPLPPQDLLVLLTTGQLPSTLATRGAEEHARFVGDYLARQVIDAWFGSDSTERGESLLDRITVEPGREVSKNGVESLLVEYELSDTFGVQFERDAYEDYNLGIVLRFRFR